MHDAGAVLGGDVLRGQHPVGPAVVVAEEVAERRRVAAPDQLGTRQPLDHVVGGVLAQLARVRTQAGLGEQVALAPVLDHHVVDARVDGDRQVAGQGPRRGGPDQRELTGLQPEAHGHRRVLAVLVDLVVHPQLVRGQRGLVVPAVGQHAKALVDQALVVEGLERPQHRLHVGAVEGLVVVVEVDPARLPGDVGLPLVGVAQHRLPARVVELVDAELDDLVLGLQAQLAHGLQLGGQPVAVPAETALDVPAAHGLVPRHDVLDVPGEQVPVVRQPVRERRPVVEDELVAAVLPGGVARHRGLEGAVVLPERQHPLLQLRELRAGRHAVRASSDDVGTEGRGSGRLLRVGHACVSSSWAAARTRTTSPPRYHLACRRRRTGGRPLWSKAMTGPPVRV